MRYVRDYAIPYAERSGELNHVRAPRTPLQRRPARRRRLISPPPSREERVDERFDAVSGIASGGHADLRACSVTNSIELR